MKKLSRNQSGFSAIEALLILIIILLIGFIGYYVWHARNNADKTLNTANHASATTQTARSAEETTQFTLPANWTWYKNNDLGIKLAYPTNWGKPNLTFASKGDIGTEYELDFYPPPAYKARHQQYNSRTPVSISFASNDYSSKTCNDAGCSTQVATYTKTNIQAVLSSIANKSYDASKNGTLVSSTSDSYTTIYTKVANTDGSNPDTVDGINYSVIASFPKINVSGLQISYSIMDTPASCASNKLSSNTEQFCLNQSAVDTVSKVVDSISAIN